jgi:hypothetical protein
MLLRVSQASAEAAAAHSLLLLATRLSLSHAEQPRISQRLCKSPQRLWISQISENASGHISR